MYNSKVYYHKYEPAFITGYLVHSDYSPIYSPVLATISHVPSNRDIETREWEYKLVDMNTGEVVHQWWGWSFNECLFTSGALW